jgi:hypothetical protein
VVVALLHGDLRMCPPSPFWFRAHARRRTILAFQLPLHGSSLLLMAAAVSTLEGASCDDALRFALAPALCATPPQDPATRLLCLLYLPWHVVLAMVGVVCTRIAVSQAAERQASDALAAGLAHLSTRRPLPHWMSSGNAAFALRQLGIRKRPCVCIRASQAGDASASHSAALAAAQCSHSAALAAAQCSHSAALAAAQRVAMAELEVARTEAADSKAAHADSKAAHAVEVAALAVEVLRF